MQRPGKTCMWRSLQEALWTPEQGRKGDQTQTPAEEGLFLWVQLLFWPDHMVQPAAKTSQAQFERPRFPWSDQRCRPRKIPADNPFHARLKLQHSHTPRCSCYTAPSLSLHSLMQLLFPRLSRLGTRGGGAGLDSCLLLVLITVALLAEVSCHYGGGKPLQQWHTINVRVFTLAWSGTACTPCIALHFIFSNCPSSFQDLGRIRNAVWSGRSSAAQ